MEPTTKQVYRWWRQYFERITRYDGYQMFGYDYRTMCATNPGFKATHARLESMYQDARKREKG